MVKQLYSNKDVKKKKEVTFPESHSWSEVFPGAPASLFVKQV